MGILLQEPPLNEEKTVRGNVEEGLGEIFAKKKRFDEIAEEMATEATPTSSWKKWASCRKTIDAADAWELDSKIEQAMEALRCPPGRRCPSPTFPVVSAAASRCAKLLLPRPSTCCCSTSPPTTSTPSPSCGWSSTCNTTRAPSSPSPTTATSSTTSPQWICEVDRGKLYPYEGNYSTYLETKAERLDVAGQEGREARKTPRRKNSTGSAPAPKARQAKNKARLQRYEEMAAEAEQYKKLDFEEIQIPDAAAPGQPRLWKSSSLHKGFDGRVLINDLSFTLPRNGIVGVIGPNGVGKTTLFKTIVGLEHPDDGELKVGQTVQLSLR